jgi:hypothetical protein
MKDRENENTEVEGAKIRYREKGKKPKRRI